MIKIFAEKELREFLDERRHIVIAGIDNEEDNYLLNVNEADYINFKKSEGIIEPLEILVDNRYASSSEQMIPAEYFPGYFDVEPGRSYKKDVIKLHIPFSGNQELLKCRPSTHLLWSIKVEVSDNEISFEIINFNDDVDKIQREIDDNIKNILQQYENLKKDITSYNANLEYQIRSAFESRKERIKAKTGVLESLGIPIKKASAPSTFTVPTIQKKKTILVTRPKVHDAGYKPEPTLDKNTYTEILKLIHDVGKEFERLPSLYADKEEEHLRDHFLLMLEPNFNGTATGETFNKTGKTDILLRHEGTNVFIGECKFWKGIKSFQDTISQLLGYLTWRDSKAAVIIFVQNKDFSSVLSTVKDKIKKHPNFLRFLQEQDETWLNYEFHLNGDRNRIVKVAVMLYHIPSK